MKAPSVKKLTAAFDISAKEAKLVRAFAAAADDRDALEELVEKVPATESYVRSLYSSPYRSQRWRETVALHAIDTLIGGFGVEPLDLGDSDPTEAPDYEYINMGDTYARTLVFDRAKDRLILTDYGTIVEKTERQRNPRSAAGAPPKEVGQMLDKAIVSLQNRGGLNMDLSDRRQAVQIYGMAFSLLRTWAHGGENVNYANYQEIVGWKPASKAAADWHNTTNDTRHRTQVMAAFKRNWPEAHEWMVKHQMGESKAKRKKGAARASNPEVRKIKNRVLR